MLSSPFHPTHPLKPILTIFLALKLWEHHTSYGPTPLTAPFFQNVFIRSLVVLTKLKKYVSSPKTLYQLQEGKNHIIYCCWTTIFIIQIIIVSSSSSTFRCFKGTSNATCQKKISPSNSCTSFTSLGKSSRCPNFSWYSLVILPHDCLSSYHIVQIFVWLFINYLPRQT